MAKTTSRRNILSLIGLLSCLPPHHFALAEPPSAAAKNSSAMMSLDLDDLVNMEITLASKKIQRVGETAAAIHVITREDIRRSGATSVPELLRWVPGANVSQVSGSQWTVSMRGFNGQWANKLLVLQDGRELYTPLYAGVYWEAQNLMLEQIERIEVIRGPGASIWGANAVNGVINIITQHAGDAQGTTLAARLGTKERAAIAAHHGTDAGEDGFVHLFAHAADTQPNSLRQGGAANDHWRGARAGFRLDKRIGADTYFLSGDLADVKAGDMFDNPSLTLPGGSELLRSDKKFNSAFVLGRWRRQQDNGGEFSLQSYVDTTRNDFSPVYREQRDTVDIQFQQHINGSIHDIVWGVGYQSSRDSTASSFITRFAPTARTLQKIGAFVHDDITLVPERWKIVLGARVDRNDYSGAEWQPNLRMLWTPNRRQSAWIAVSRAVRTPSRADTDLRLNFRVVPAIPPSPFPSLLSNLGNPNVKSERLTALDLGYRLQLGPHASIDLTGFRYRYTNTIRYRLAAPTPVFAAPTPYLSLPFVADNGAPGHTWGAEATLDWRPSAQSRLTLSSGYLGADFPAGEQPSHVLSLRLGFDLNEKNQIDFWWRRASAFRSTFSTIPFDATNTLDVRYATALGRHVELALVGKNLLKDKQREYLSTYSPTSDVELRRGVYAKITWRY